jgi:hypothetical protein
MYLAVFQYPYIVIHETVSNIFSCKICKDAANRLDLMATGDAMISEGIRWM